MKIHILGFPRIGIKRELKFYMENYWNTWSLKDENNLIKIKFEICKQNWNLQIKYNLNYITVGDFSFYDHVLDNLIYFNGIPERYKLNYKNLSLKDYFSFSQGNHNQPPMEITKWFNTNYHYIVPEYSIYTNFNYDLNWILKDIITSKLLNHPIKIILLGPLSLLKLGKIKDNKLKNRLLLLPDLTLCYINFINSINLLGVNVIQLDEPILILNISKIWTNCFEGVYNLICSYFKNIILTTYFGEVKNYFNIIKNLPFKVLHIDIINNKQINFFFNNSFKNKIISLGIINGKNIWINNLEKSYYILKNIKDNFKEIWLSTSCSLLYIPIDVNYEIKIDKKIKNWLSFSIQKINELILLKNVINFYKLSKDFIKNIFFIQEKKKSPFLTNFKIQNKIKNLNNLNFLYRAKYKIRKYFQNKYLKLPMLPTTTIGSFPQTKKIRKIRSNYKNNIITKILYEKKIKNEIKFIINKQLKYDLDVLVHGEPERNDMVEYFANLLNGFLVTNYGWVQSYGSRCVKPPIIYGDIYSFKNMTLKWIRYAQNLTIKHLKGMLTGSITMCKWSFIRNDQPSYVTALQISLILKKEILELEKYNIKIIQIDEPALAEYLPFKKKNFKLYFNWAIKTFLLSCNNVKNTTQIHTHICYSEINNILYYINNLDVDVISIEAVRSNMEILSFFINYNNEIGLGIYDIHSKRLLKINYAIYLIKLILNYIPENKIWINPDCGLKTRKWNEIENSLINMVTSSKIIRNNI